MQPSFKMKILYTLFFATTLSLFSCEKNDTPSNNPITYGETYLKIDISTDKAVYTPGSTVRFSLASMPSGSYKVRYSYLGEVIKEEPLTSASWQWVTPANDYRGYLVEIYQEAGGKQNTYGSIAVDVSSDWTKFPRYGFLSSYGKNEPIEKNIDFMNRCHINGIQFYDWMYDHHKPLAGTPQNPANEWPDLFKRPTFLSTVRGYISAAHSKGMKAMFYNLAFGALKNAEADGVAKEWFLYKDNQHKEKDAHLLGDFARSSIYLTNPGNAHWQNYLAGRNSDVYAVFGFDGYHIDQLGGRGTVYDYNGNSVDLLPQYASFINAMKSTHPDKRLVMNAVGQYGQTEIAGTNKVDFLYTEVWDEKTYDQLARIILDNYNRSNNQLKTVLAAYMDYEKSKNAGFVNEPGVLLTNAVIFAFGGAHLEIGEHYLANEYFPNKNLQMKADLKKALITYYDFLVAYQNLLRDGGSYTSAQVTAENATIAAWPAAKDQIACVSKKVNNKEVIHLINFNGVTSMDWRDTNGTQKKPTTVTDLKTTVAVTAQPKKVWFATPDLFGGAPRAVEFTYNNNQITFTLPSLSYWDMVVIEY